MRAFARDLALAPSRLSLILRGKEGLSLARARLVAERLGYGPEQSDFFCALVQSRDARSAAGRAAARSRIQSEWSDLKRPLEEDEFRSVADWHHFAILHMTELADFDPSCEAIAARLGLEVETARSAVARLLRLGLLVREDGGVRKSSGAFIHSEKKPVAAVREYHRQILDRASRAVDGQDMSRRTLSSLTVAIDTAKLKEANERLKAFIRDMELLLTAGSTEKNDVYCLSVQLFSLQEKPE